MDPRVPIPTDNVYKFLALFGLFLVILSITFLFINATYSNSMVEKTAQALYELGDITSGSEQEVNDKKIMQSFYEKKLEVVIADRGTIKVWLAFVMALGIVIAGIGFYEWFTKIQPQNNRILDLEERKLKLEVEALERQVPQKDESEKQPG